MNSKKIIAIDFGGTKIKMAIVEHDKIIAQSSMDSISENGLRERLSYVKNEIDLLLLNESISAADVSGVGISMPGIVDSVSKKVLSIDKKFGDAPEINFTKWVNDSWGLKLEMDNDARCAMLGEWQFGNAKGYNDALIMTLGTGIGSSAIMNGKILRGKHFMAGILGGHSTININGSVCNCGNIGCGETEIATWNMEAKIKADEWYYTSILKYEDKLDFETIFRLADADTLAKKIRNKAMDVWSVCAVNLIHAYDPEILVLSGGIMQSSTAIIRYLQHKINEHAWTPWGKIKIVKAANSNTASLLGAAYLLSQKL